MRTTKIPRSITMRCLVAALAAGYGVALADYDAVTELTKP